MNYCWHIFVVTKVALIYQIPFILESRTISLIVSFLFPNTRSIQNFSKGLKWLEFEHFVCIKNQYRPIMRLVATIKNSFSYLVNFYTLPLDNKVLSRMNCVRPSEISHIEQQWHSLSILEKWIRRRLNFSRGLKFLRIGTLYVY